MANSEWFGEYGLARVSQSEKMTVRHSRSEWKDSSWTSLLALRRGVQQIDAPVRTSLFGANAINIEARSTFQILIDEVLHPFYVFQIFSIILWTFDDYYCESLFAARPCKTSHSPRMRSPTQTTHLQSFSSASSALSRP